MFKLIKLKDWNNFRLTCSLFLSSAKQVNVAQNGNESNSAWPWNYTCLILTLETQLNSSALNQSGAAWMNMHFDWVSGNHNPLSRAVWQPPAVQHLTCGSLQSFLFLLCMVCFGGSQAKPFWNEMNKTFLIRLLKGLSPLHRFIIWTIDREAICTYTVHYKPWSNSFQMSLTQVI